MVRPNRQSTKILLRLQPLRLALMFVPIWFLFGPSLYLYWDRWMANPVLMTLIGGMPVIAWGLGEVFLKDRWMLEMAPKGLIHHTIIGEEVFEWQQMGPVSVQSRGPLNAFTVFTFPYPIDADAPQEIITKHMGRAILGIFGRGASIETATIIEAQRQSLQKRR